MDTQKTPDATPQMETPEQAEAAQAIAEGERVLSQASKVLSALEGKKLSAGILQELQGLETDLKTLQTRIASQKEKSAVLQQQLTNVETQLKRAEAIRRNIALMEAKVTLTAPGEWDKFVKSTNAAFARIEEFEIDPQRKDPKFAELEQAYAFAKTMYNDNYIELPGKGEPDDKMCERMAYMTAALRMLEVIATQYEQEKGEAPTRAKTARETLTDAKKWSTFVDRANAAVDRRDWYRYDPDHDDPKYAAVDSQYNTARAIYNENHIAERPKEISHDSVKTFAKMQDGVRMFENGNDAYLKIAGDPPKHVKTARRYAEAYGKGGQYRRETLGLMNSIIEDWSKAETARAAVLASPEGKPIQVLLDRARTLYQESLPNLGKSPVATERTMMAIVLVETALDRLSAIPDQPSVKEKTAPEPKRPETPPADVAPPPKATPKSMTPPQNDTPPEPSRDEGIQKTPQPSPDRRKMDTPEPPARNPFSDAPPAMERRVAEEPTPNAPNAKPIEKKSPKGEPPPITVPDVQGPPQNEPQKKPIPTEQPKAPASTPAVPETKTPAAPPEAARETKNVSIENGEIIVKAKSISLTYRLGNAVMNTPIVLGPYSGSINMPGRFSAVRTPEGWRITLTRGQKGSYFLDTQDGRYTVSTDMTSVERNDYAAGEAPIASRLQKTMGTPRQPEYRVSSPVRTRGTTFVRGQPVRNFLRRVFRR